MKKSLRLAVLLVPLLATWAFAGIYSEVEVKSPGEASTVTRYISGTSDRIEGRSRSGEVVVIHYQGKVYCLMPQEKKYLEMAATHEPSPDEDARVQVTVIKTEQTKKIGNYNCTRYDVTISGMRGMPPGAESLTTYWMTTEVDVADEYEKFSDALARRQSTKLAIEMAKVKGFPIMTVTNTAAGEETLTVTTVKKQDVPDSMFEVPADYQRITIRVPGATPPAAPSAARPQGGAGAGKGQ